MDKESDKNTKEAIGSLGSDDPAIILRVIPSTPEDRRGIYDILLNSGIFHREDAECVDEMFSISLTRNSVDDYRFLSCWEVYTRDKLSTSTESDSDDIHKAPVASKLIGFACYGSEALTNRTWDLFWICVSGAARRKGAGRALLAEVQHRAAQERVRLMVIYTSSTDKYTPARGLYEALGFTREAVIPDYYADNDDLFIYTKRITRKE